MRDSHLTELKNRKQKKKLNVIRRRVTKRNMCFVFSFKNREKKLSLEDVAEDALVAAKNWFGPSFCNDFAAVFLLACEK